MATEMAVTATAARSAVRTTPPTITVAIVLLSFLKGRSASSRVFWMVVGGSGQR